MLWASPVQARTFIITISFLVGAWGVSVPLAYVLAFPVDLGLKGLWYVTKKLLVSVFSTALFFSSIAC